MDAGAEGGLGATGVFSPAVAVFLAGLPPFLPVLASFLDFSTLFWAVLPGPPAEVVVAEGVADVTFLTKIELQTVLLRSLTKKQI